MKPMIKYRGGKSKEIPELLKHIPEFSGRYVEPFFGGGAMFFYLEPKKAIINDINSRLMNFYRGVRDDYSGLRRELDEIEALYKENRKSFDALKSMHPSERVEDKNEEMYYALRAMYNGLTDKKYSDALLYFYINKTAYSGMIRYNVRGEFNVPFGRYKQLNTSVVTEAHSRLLKNAEIYSMDYRPVFDKCKENDFVFLDPPYDCVFSDYGNEEYRDGFSESSHRRLAQDFHNLPCKALMVIGRTSLTEGLYRGYIVGEYEKNYAVNIRNRFKSTAKHVIVINYRKLWSLNSDSRSLYRQQEAVDFRLFEATHPYGKN